MKKILPIIDNKTNTIPDLKPSAVSVLDANHANMVFRHYPTIDFIFCLHLESGTFSRCHNMHEVEIFYNDKESNKRK